MDTSGVSYAALVSVADVSASTIPVEKGYLELEDDKNVENFVAVSYTHLTLPTILLV